MKKIKCNTIDYRQGFIEVLGNIHANCVNLEVFWIHPEIDLSKKGLTFNEIPDKCFTGNVELELSLENVKELLVAIEKAKLDIKKEQKIARKKAKKKAQKKAQEKAQKKARKKAQKETKKKGNHKWNGLFIAPI